MFSILHFSAGFEIFVQFPSSNRQLKLRIYFPFRNEVPDLLVSTLFTDTMAYMAFHVETVGMFEVFPSDFLCLFLAYFVGLFPKKSRSFLWCHSSQRQDQMMQNFLLQEIALWLAEMHCNYNTNCGQMARGWWVKKVSRSQLWLCCAVLFVRCSCSFWTSVRWAFASPAEPNASGQRRKGCVCVCVCVYVCVNIGEGKTLGN